MTGIVAGAPRGSAGHAPAWAGLPPPALFSAMAGPDNRAFVERVIGRLTVDPAWTAPILAQVRSGSVEIRMALSWLAQQLRPAAYLEIGVRRGLSMATVAARCPGVEIYGFDRWVPNYAGVPNPGPSFVQSELRRVGYDRTAHFVNGNSHHTLPAFFHHRDARMRDRIVMAVRCRRHPATFDLITVDGDHSLLGAYQDLLHVMPHCEMGGAVVFDDIATDRSTIDPAALAAERVRDPYRWENLLGVWRAIRQRFPDFAYFEYLEHPPGVGVAVRVA